MVVLGTLHFVACKGPDAPPVPPVEVFGDVPVPQGFSLRRDISRTVEEARFMRLTYELPSSYGVERVADFYDAGLRDRNWTFVNDSEVLDEKVWSGRWSRDNGDTVDGLVINYRERKNPDVESGRIAVIEIKLN